MTYEMHCLVCDKIQDIDLDKNEFEYFKRGLTFDIEHEDSETNRPCNGKSLLCSKE